MSGSVDERETTLSGHSDRINALILTKNGYLVSGAADSTIKVEYSDLNITLI